VNIIDRRDLLLAVAVVVSGGLGTYLLLPHRHGSAKPARVHVAGGVLIALALLLFAFFWTPPQPLLARLFFYAFGIAAVGGGVLMITTPNPVYSALWFASVVLSTSGLFLLAAAQFLAAGTVIVYAGAIIVTFLFVIMLAQMEGRAPYDRAAREPRRTTITCFLLFWGLLYALFLVRPSDVAPGTAAGDHPRLPRGSLALLTPPAERPAVTEVEARARFHSSLLLGDSRGRPKPHVAGLGESLYTDHLVTVELAGVLLFVALVGAVAIAAPRPPVRPRAAPAETLPGRPS
jgi:NADH-quinone oxidoreductase subunit J